MEGYGGVYGPRMWRSSNAHVRVAKNRNKIGSEYRLFLCDCAVTAGRGGNIWPGGVLQHLGGLDGETVLAQFTNPAPGRFGQSWESAEDLRRRFAGEMRQIRTAVTAADYEYLAKHTPGLCIHKVRATERPEKHLVKLVVKPYTNKKHPLMSERYLRQLRSYLEQRRMLTTRMEIHQPRYVAVDVIAEIYIRGRDEAGSGAEIRQALCRMLDHVDSDAPFGGCVRFNEIYQRLSDLPCVEAVDTLRLIPVGPGAELSGGDVLLEEDSLCYPGRLQIGLHIGPGSGRRVAR